MLEEIFKESVFLQSLLGKFFFIDIMDVVLNLGSFVLVVQDEIAQPVDELGIVVVDGWQFEEVIANIAVSLGNREQILNNDNAVAFTTTVLIYKNIKN